MRDLKKGVGKKREGEREGRRRSMSENEKEEKTTIDDVDADAGGQALLLPAPRPASCPPCVNSLPHPATEMVTAVGGLEEEVDMVE